MNLSGQRIDVSLVWPAFSSKNLLPAYWRPCAESSGMER